MRPGDHWEHFATNKQSSEGYRLPLKTWINNNSSREVLKSCVVQSTEKPDRVESLFTTAQHTLDRTRKITIVAKPKVTKTKRSACWEEHGTEGKKLLCAFSLKLF